MYNVPMRMTTLTEQVMIEGMSRGWGRYCH